MSNWEDIAIITISFTTFNIVWGIIKIISTLYNMKKTNKYKKKIAVFFGISISIVFIIATPLCIKFFNSVGEGAVVNCRSY